EWRHGGVRPRVHVWAVIRRVDDDRVVGDTKIVKRLEKFADVAVVLDHAVAVLVVRHTALTPHRVAHMREGMHAGRVEPTEKRFLRLDLTLDEIDCGVSGL